MPVQLNLLKESLTAALNQGGSQTNSQLEQALQLLNQLISSSGTYQEQLEQQFAKNQAF
jgi:hypothetical protein